METKKREIVLVAAVAEGRMIGNKNGIPWWNDVELRKADMRRFRELTLDRSVIMGRSTAESIIKNYVERGKSFTSFKDVLLRRRPIIVSRQPSYIVPGADVFPTIPQALDFAFRSGESVYVIGGQQMYEQMIGQANRLEMTEIERQYSGDAFFPKYKDTGEWERVAHEPHEGFAFAMYLRKREKT